MLCRSPVSAISLNREIRPAAWIGLNKEGLWVAGATILPEQRCLRHKHRKRGVGGAAVTLQVAPEPSSRSSISGSTEISASWPPATHFIVAGRIRGQASEVRISLVEGNNVSSSP